ncbi:MAG: glycosyltransferase [Deltaproteobacteria bacterium]|nr:glycosyltransferase [Deltaproteobacteria bacterium]
MSDRATLVVAIMPTYNRREMMARAVESVFAQTRRPDIFLVLDHASSDGSAEELARLAGSKPMDFRILTKTGNIGASGAMRFLIDEALKLKPDWIWFMDDDAAAEPRALGALLDAPESRDSSVMLLESTVVDGNGVWTEANRPAIFKPETFEFEGLPENALDSGRALEVHTGGYCGWFARPKCFEEFGYPRDDFYFWFDDIEYVVRVSRKSKVYLIPGSRIRHYATSLVPHERRWPFSGPLPKIPLQHLERYFYWNRNWLWFAKQWLPRAKYATFWLKHVARGIAAPVLFHQDHLARRARLVLMAGLDALRGRLGKRPGVE